jgi:transporter family protein
MSWQILIGLHVAFSTIYALLFRKVAQEFPDTPRLSMALIYLLVIFPLGLIAAFFQGGIDINMSLQIWIFLVFGGVLFTGFSVFGYMANSHVDATQFAVIQNTQAVFTIIVSGLLLGEQLSSEQLIGVAMLVIGAIVVSVKGFNRSTFRFSKWSVVAMISALFVGAAFSNEKYLLGQMNQQTYYVFGWGVQTLVMCLVAGKEWQQITKFNKKMFTGIMSLGLLRSISGFAGLGALALIDSSLVSSIRSYKSVLVFIAGYFILKEKEHVIRKAIGAVLATIGLLLLID